MINRKIEYGKCILVKPSIALSDFTLNEVLNFERNSNSLYHVWNERIDRIIASSLFADNFILTK